LQSESNDTSQFTDFILSRTATTGNHAEQLHDWNISPSHTTCSAGLHSCRMYDAGGMGAFGTFDLNFTPTARATTKNEICGGVVVATSIKRPGLLTGTFRIKTGTNYFGTIRNSGTHVRIPSSLPATAKQTTPNGADCGPITLPPCRTVVELFASTLDFFIFGVRAADEPSAVLEIGVQDFTNSKVVQIQHVVQGDVPKATLTVTSNDPKPLQRAKVKFGALAPFATGSARFDATEDPSPPDTCSFIHRDGTLHGSVAMTFDGFGTRTFTSADAVMFRSHS
jgi:hypothetical protein